MFTLIILTKGTLLSRRPHYSLPLACFFFGSCLFIHILPLLLHVLPSSVVFLLDQEGDSGLAPQLSFSPLLPASPSMLKTLKPMSLAPIFQPPQRPECQLLLEHLPFQFWKCSMLNLHQIFEQTIFSGLQHSLPLTQPCPPTGGPKCHLKSLFLPLLCSLTPTPTAPQCLHYHSPQSCHCVLTCLPPHTKLSTPPALGLCCVYHWNPNTSSSAWHLVGAW